MGYRKKKNRANKKLLGYATSSTDPTTNLFTPSGTNSVPSTNPSSAKATQAKASSPQVTSLAAAVLAFPSTRRNDALAPLPRNDAHSPPAPGRNSEAQA
jgi:hypothetical protein